MNIRAHSRVACLLTLGLFFLLNETAMTQSLEIVVEGEAQTAIVVPESPHRTERYAAEELQHHIEKASGARLDIIAENEPDAEARGRIHVGDTAAARELAGIDINALEPHAFVIRMAEGRLFFAGEDHDVFPENFLSTYNRVGTLFAVYEFLRQHLGVRWLWPGELGEFVPEHRTIVLEHWDQQQTPPYRHLNWSMGSGTLSADHWPDPEKAEQFQFQQQQWLKRLGFHRTEHVGPSHNFSDYWQRYGQSQPELFNLLPNGRREPLPGDTTGSVITMCVSEPALWERIVEAWDSPDRDFQRTDPPTLRIGENDSPAMCTCERCRSWDAPDWRFHTSPYWAEGKIPERGDRFRGANVGLVGESSPWGGWFILHDAPSLSDRYARFYKQVHERAQAVDRDVVVAGYAYANYWRAPKQVELHEQIFISFVPPLWFPYTESMSRDMRAEWDGWRRTGATLMFRPNHTHAGYPFPVYYAQPMIDDLKHIVETGAVAFHFDSLIGSYAAQGPTLYSLARVLQRPDLEAEDILAEYYAAFGPAEQAVRDYFGHWEQHARTISKDEINRYHFEEDGGGSFTGWSRIGHRVFPPEVLAEGRALIEQAHEAAAGDDRAAARVQFLDDGLRHAELIAEAMRHYSAYQTDGDEADQRAYERAFERLHLFRLQIQDRPVANLGHAARREPAAWRELAAVSSLLEAPDDAAHQKQLWDEWLFRKDPDNRGVDEAWYSQDQTDAWTAVDVPAFLAETPIGDYLGYGWYRTTFTLPDETAGHTLTLLFQGVDEQAWVYLNGQLVREHTTESEGLSPGELWNKPFAVRIEPAKLREGENTLVVRIHASQANAGIWRPVQAFTTPPDDDLRP